MSRSTYLNDVGEIVDKCRLLKIPFYIIFSMYKLKSDLYEPPFLRIYEYKEDINEYITHDINAFALEEGKEEIIEKNLYHNPKLPFRLGLEKLKMKTPDTENLSRLLFVDKEELKKLYSSEEYAKKKAEDAQKKAEEERKLRLEMEKKIKELEEKISNKN